MGSLMGSLGYERHCAEIDGADMTVDMVRTRAVEPLSDNVSFG